MNAFALEHPRDCPDKRVGVLYCEARQHLNHFQVGHDRAEDLFVLHLPSHHRLIDAFGFESLDQLSQLAERHPVNCFGMLFNLREGFFLDCRNDHIDPLSSCRFEHEKGKFPVACNETVPT